MLIYLSTQFHSMLPKWRNSISLLDEKYSKSKVKQNLFCFQQQAQQNEIAKSCTFLWAHKTEWAR